MKMRRLLAIVAALTAALPTFAQYEGTQVNDRIGHGNDSIDCLENLSLFQQYYKSKDYKDAYEAWKVVMQKAPLAQASLYTRGAPMLAALIQGATDKAEKKTYLDELMAMYDQRIKYVKELNSFSSALMQTSKGSILCRKAYDYAIHAPKIYSDYSIETAYKMFTEGINLVNQDPSHEVEGFVLYGYFQVSLAKFKADENGFREQFLKDYLLCKEVCEKMLEKANSAGDSVAAKKIVDAYDPTLLAVEQGFAESKAADRDQLIAIFTPKVEQKKTDLNYLQSVIDVLAANDCDDTDVYFKASRYAYELKPTFASAIGTAQYCTKMGKNAESIKYYDKAIELCPDNQTKAKIAMRVAYALAKSGQGGSVDSYLNKVASYDPTMQGKCDLYRAQRAAAAGQYAPALSFAARAASEDPSISGVANRLRSRIQNAQKRQAEYNKANAEYKAQLEKQQKLENFWKGN